MFLWFGHNHIFGFVFKLVNLCHFRHLRHNVSSYNVFRYFLHFSGVGLWSEDVHEIGKLSSLYFCLFVNFFRHGNSIYIYTVARPIQVFYQ